MTHRNILVVDDEADLVELRYDNIKTIAEISSYTKGEKEFG